jgi:hypothetical protein
VASADIGQEGGHRAEQHMRNRRQYIGLFLVGCSTLVQAASVSMTVSTTVFAVPCPAEQRARMRACATPEQQLSVGPRKTTFTGGSRALQRNAPEARQEILADPSGHVMVRTLLY